MESPILGVVLDSSVLIAAERAGLNTPQAVRNIRTVIGEVRIAICALTVAEIAHGIYRARSPEQAARRRQFLDELKGHLPILPVTESTAEIVARIGAWQAAQGITVPLADLIIGATAIELGFAVGTLNVRDFRRIPGLNVLQI